MRRCCWFRCGPRRTNLILPTSSLMHGSRSCGRTWMLPAQHAPQLSSCSSSCRQPRMSSLPPGANWMQVGCKANCTCPLRSTLASDLHTHVHATWVANRQDKLQAHPQLRCCQCMHLVMHCSGRLQNTPISLKYCVCMPACQ